MGKKNDPTFHCPGFTRRSLTVSHHGSIKPSHHGLDHSSDFVEDFNLGGLATKNLGN
jgi:hypothetical protein